MRTLQNRGLTRAVTVALLAGVALTGCGRDEGGDAADTTAKKVSGGKASGDITVWALGAEGEKLGEIAEDFEAENPDAKVKVTVIPFDAAHDKIATAIAGGQTPDMTLLGTTWLPEFAATGALDPTPTDVIDESKFFEGSWNTTVVDGTSFGAPWYTETRQIYYRKDLAEKAGVMPAAGWSWDDLKAFAVAMQEKGGAKWGISLQPGGQGSWQSMVPFAWQKGAELVADDKFTFNTPPMQEALDYYASYFEDGISPTDLAQGALEPGFIDGSIGAFISGPWHIGILGDQGGADFESKWAVAPMPTEDAGTSFTGGSDWAVFKDSKNRDTAWKFVDFLTQDPQQQKLYELVGSLPAVQSTWESGELSTDPLLKSFGDQLQDAKSAPAIATWEQVAAPLDDAIEQVSLGKSDSETALADAESKANGIGFGKLTMATVTAASTAGSSTSRGRPDRGRRREVAAGYLFSLPFLALFLVFTIGPVIASFLMSFTDLRSADIRDPLAVGLTGLENYSKLLSDETFHQAAFNTAYFVVVGVPLTMVLALAVAVLLDSGITRFRTFFRVGYYLPVVTSIVAVAVVWRFLLQPDSGIVNTLLGYVGVEGPSWLRSETWAMPSLIVMSAWRNMGSLVIIFLAGLQVVPKEMHEAAAIDGAGAWGRFRHITLPLMRPTLLFGSVITMIGYLQFFEEPFIMTRGGPLDSTLSSAYYTYNQFGFGNYSYAAAMAYVLFVVIALVTAVQFKFLGSKD